MNDDLNLIPKKRCRIRHLIMHKHSRNDEVSSLFIHTMCAVLFGSNPQRCPVLKCLMVRCSLIKCVREGQAEKNIFYTISNGVRWRLNMYTPMVAVMFVLLVAQALIEIGFLKP